MTVVLMLGSAPQAVQAANWLRSGLDRIVAINNAARIRPDWDDGIFPWDFPEDRRPVPGAKPADDHPRRFLFQHKTPLADLFTQAEQWPLPPPIGSCTA